MKRTLLMLVRAEVERMLADRNILLVLVAAPLVYTLIFGLTYRNAKVFDLPVAVVDLDRSATSRALARNLDAHESIRVGAMLADEAPVRGLLMREECWAAVVIPRGMERELKRGRQVTVPVMLNGSNIIIGNYALKGVQSVLGTAGVMAGVDRMMRRGVAPAAVLAAVMPMEIRTHTLFNPASNYAFFVVPLLIILLVHQIAALAAGMSEARRWESGAVPPLAAFALRPGADTVLPEVLSIQARALPYVVTGAFWLVLSMIGTHPWLGMPVPASVGAAVVLGVLIAWNGTMIGMLAGVLVRDKIGVVQVLFFLSMPLLLLSGGSWPLESMPWVVRALAVCLPTTHAMGAYRMLTLEGASFLRVLPVVLVLAGMGVVFSSLVVLVVRGRRSRSHAQ